MVEARVGELLDDLEVSRRVGPAGELLLDVGHDASRVRYCSVTDQEALDAFHLCGRLEGILPALETAHAVVEAMRIAATQPKDDAVVVCFSGRGDKDCAEVARLTGEPRTPVRG